MADDRRVLKQALDVGPIEGGDLLGHEAGERAAEVLALAQDRDPREAGLEPLEAELLEEPDVVDDRTAPLVVVVVDIVVGRARPPATGDAVVSGLEPRRHPNTNMTPNKSNSIGIYLGNFTEKNKER